MEFRFFLHFCRAYRGTLLFLAILGCGGVGHAQRAAPKPIPPVRSLIAFVSTRDGQPEIYVMNPDGTGQTRVTSGIGSADNPSQSRDGRIVFQSNRDGNFEIYRVNRDGSDLTRLTKDAAKANVFDIQPAFSPDGKTIAWTSGRGGKTNIWLMDSTGRNQRQFTKDIRSSNTPAWTADSTRLGYFFDTGTGFRDSIQSLELRNVTTGQIIFSSKATTSSPTHLRFNFDTSQAIYSGGTLGFSTLRRYDFASGQESRGPKLPPEDAGRNRAPDFSPDGHSIIWDGLASDNPDDIVQGRVTTQIFRADTEGRAITSLTNRGANFSPDW